MSLPKPSSQLDWTETNPTARTEPSGSKKETGWGSSEKPAFQHMNWALFNTDEWVKYLESITDDHASAIADLEGLKDIYAAIVGPSVSYPVTHTTLASALADTDVTPGSKILILAGTYPLSATTQITKNSIQIDCHPDVIFTVSGGATTAIQVTGTRIKWVGGRFVSWNKAIQVDGVASYCRIYDVNFATCTTEIDDQNGASVFQGNITE